MFGLPHPLSENRNGLAINEELAVLRLDSPWVLAVGRIVLEQVGLEIKAGGQLAVLDTGSCADHHPPLTMYSRSVNGSFTATISTSA